ncbi:Lrp/AsnC family transcriptional regulator [Lentibacillus sp. N15]
MDKIDVNMLRILQLDGRISISDLSKKLALSRPSVSERLKRLQEKGIIEGFSAQVPPASVGKKLMFMIELSELRVSQYEFEKMIIDEPNVMECHRATGHVHYYIKVALKGTDELTRLIEKLIPYGSTKTSVLLTTPVVKHVVLPD